MSQAAIPVKAAEAAILAVAVGASAGAVEVLLQLLPALPASFPLPVFVVVHIPRYQETALAHLFDERSQVEVKDAEDKELIRSGVVYFAPADYHLLVEPDRKRLSLSSDEPVLYSRPAIDVLLESAADAYGEHLLAIVLTGASADGAAGLRAVCTAGGRGVVQDPESAYASVMPRHAVNACPEAKVLSVEGIAKLLQSLPRDPSMP